LNFVNRDALDQSIGTKRIDATVFNAPILPQKNGEITMMKPITENINDIQPIATKID
ncbi:unnamed protein product, partial [Rotaria sordida]